MGRYPRPVALDDGHHRRLESKSPRFLAPRKTFGWTEDGAAVSMNCIEQGQSVSLCANRVFKQEHTTGSFQPKVHAAGIHSGSISTARPTLVGKIGIDPAGILSDTGMDDPLGAIKLARPRQQYSVAF